MKTYERCTTFPMLRRSFESSSELEEALNKSRSYVSARLCLRKPFSMRDKRKALEYLKQPIEKMDEFFPEEG